MIGSQIPHLRRAHVAGGLVSGVVTISTLGARSLAPVLIEDDSMIAEVRLVGKNP